MRRYDQTRFIAFGLLPAINPIAPLLLGLNLSTHGTGGAGRSAPLVATLAIAPLLCAMVAAIKRGRDIGWSPLHTIAAFWVMLGMGPVLLLRIAVTFLRKINSQNRLPG